MTTTIPLLPDLLTGCDTEVLTLARKTPHPRDQRIAFRASDHVYFIDGVSGKYTSVTTVISRQFPSFDADAVAKNMVTSNAFINGHKKYEQYMHMKAACSTDQELVDTIKRSWATLGGEEASKGTSLHRDIELFYNDVDVDVLNTSPEYGHFTAYAQDMAQLGLRPWRTELKVFGEAELISGSVDMVFVDREGRFRLRDWKRSKKISYFGFGKKANGLLSHLHACNFQKYSLQLNLYKYLIDKYYGITIFDMAIVVFHPNQSTYQELKIDHNPRNLAALLKMHELWALYGQGDEEKATEATEATEPMATEPMAKKAKLEK